jgi:hypothetical protein
MSECDREASVMRRPIPLGLLCLGKDVKSKIVRINFREEFIS